MAEDELVAQQLGAVNASELTQTQEQYKDAIKRKLEEVRGRCVCGAGVAHTGAQALPVRVPCSAGLGSSALALALGADALAATTSLLAAPAARGGAAAREGGQANQVWAGQEGL